MNMDFGLLGVFVLLCVQPVLALWIGFSLHRLKNEKAQLREHIDKGNPMLFHECGHNRTIRPYPSVLCSVHRSGVDRAVDFEPISYIERMKFSMFRLQDELADAHSGQSVGD